MTNAPTDAVTPRRETPDHLGAWRPAMLYTSVAMVGIAGGLLALVMVATAGDAEAGHAPAELQPLTVAQPATAPGLDPQRQTSAAPDELPPQF